MSERFGTPSYEPEFTYCRLLATFRYYLCSYTQFLVNPRTWFRTRVSSQGDYCCSAAELCAESVFD